jgi:DNA invertase Pin-like site-specific DNA recombinase
MPATKRSPVTHPYARISDPAQRKGGGLERQTKANMDEFCRLFKFTLSKRLRVDDGVSAFRGLNATPGHELGKFLVEAQKGLIPPGDCLLLENWDRFSRQDIWAAIGLVNDLRQLGIHVGRLDRMKLLRCDSTDPGDFFETAVELMRSHGESARKSGLLTAAWRQKREAARKGQDMRPRKKDNRITKGMTDRLPAWVEERGGELHLIPGPTAALKRVFELSAAGYGQQCLIMKLTEERVPPFGYRTASRKGKRKGNPDQWSRGYVAKLLKDRRTIGEFQPCEMKDGKRVPSGPPIKGYYPAALTEDEFNAARAGCAQRRLYRGPRGKHVNVFSGLVWSALDGESYFATAGLVSRKGGKATWQRILKNTASLQGRAKCRTFPFATFEAAVLSMLSEVDPHEILNGDQRPDETTALKAELDGVEAELADVAAFMDGKGFSATIGQRVVALEARKAGLAEKLAEARERAAHPLSETWGEAQGLLALLGSAPDPQDARLRLRAALRRIVDKIVLLVLPRGADRLAAVQVWFAGGKRCRDYLILHRPPRANQSARTEGGWWARSFADVIKGKGVDLRRPEDARKVEALLAAVDLSDLAAD